MTTASLPDGDSAGTFLGHPRGLYVLFFAELWERFSYYGMRALLIFYLTKWWLFSDSSANLIYGAYTSLVYITPILGGYLADHYLGQRKSVVFGAVMLTIGHFLMAFEGVPGGHLVNPAINIFWLALAFIIVGSGFMKANIAVIVGQLYRIQDVRRDGAYTIFYIGINIGGFLGPIVAGWLGETYGWKYGFGAAGVGMLLGLAVFLRGKGHLLGRGEPPDPALLKKRVGPVTFETALYMLGASATVLIWLLIQAQHLVGVAMGICGIALLAYVLWTAMTTLTKHECARIFVVIFLIVLQPIFWGLFEQQGGSFNLFTDRYIDRHILGFEVPASLFQSINSFFIIALGPVMAGMWTWLGRRGWEPSTPAKFGLGLVQAGLSFLVLQWGAELVGMNNAIPVIFLILLYLLQTTGELSLSPVGLSAMNRLSPVQMTSLIMGAWYFGMAGGEFAAGLIGAATGAHDGTSGAGKALTLAIYGHIGWLGIAVGVAVLILAPIIKRGMHLDTLADGAPAATGA